MTIEESYNRIDIIIAKYEIDDEYVTITNSKDYDALRIARKALEQPPCEDAISRKQAIYVASGYCHPANVARELAKLPSVTPQPKTGQWIVDGSVDCYLDKVRCHCSECGKKKEFPADYDHIKQELSISYKNPEFIDNYCPNCGAKMQEVEE